MSRQRQPRRRAKMDRTVKELERQLRSVRGEVKEYQEFCRLKHEEIEQLKKTERHMELRLCDIYCGLMAERHDLEGRIWRIDQRIRACGFKAPADLKEGEDAGSH
jgi:L-lysine 2,3-aminomutase